MVKKKKIKTFPQSSLFWNQLFKSGKVFVLIRQQILKAKSKKVAIYGKPEKRSKRINRPLDIPKQSCTERHYPQGCFVVSPNPSQKKGVCKNKDLIDRIWIFCKKAPCSMGYGFFNRYIFFFFLNWWPRIDQSDQSNELVLITNRKLLRDKSLRNTLSYERHFARHITKL